MRLENRPCDFSCDLSCDKSLSLDIDRDRIASPPRVGVLGSLAFSFSTTENSYNSVGS